MSPGQKHKSGGSDSNNPLEINIPEFKERFEKWMVDLSNSGRDMSCGIFCRICIEASKSGGFCTKPAQEQARRCLTKHLNREKHKSALQQLRKEGKIGPNVVIASGATGLLEDFDPVGDDRSDSNDDDEHSHFNSNSHYTDGNNINNNSNSNNHHLEQSLNYSNNQDIPDDKKLIFPMTVQPISSHKSSKKMKKKKRVEKKKKSENNFFFFLMICNLSHFFLFPHS
ncbi:ubiquitin carboxyl-terminal hydrolase [Reticulomyxa filosa]|uniref:Ubiquitin carboxyl-terminal hydrolase n=1 Tax=Reticulomyxa filosa TaxID=46433 RepID=X6NLZ4_RETFI|nr:ubiquitin carboxyl-terminal hydrolase [Reticulomyxa filosa]|eukprot:ETO26923.1 ubiquitin carboxyl-terminal hydrolase [Reticulomyxa filosa]